MGLLMSAENFHGKNNHDWILHEDSDPKHRSRLCTQWKQEKHIVTLD